MTSKRVVQEQGTFDQEGKERVGAVAINALTPAETEEAVKKAGERKIKVDATRTIVSAMFAGMFIGFGALFFLIVTSDATVAWGVQRFMGGLAFCMGLVLVLCCGAELFTGNSLMVSDVASRRIRWVSMVKQWVLVWIGNALGAALLVVLLCVAGTMGLHDGAVGAVAVSTAVSKATLPWGVAFVRGMLCNILVCLAVRIGFAARSVADKVLGILLPIAGFVAMGFEHCVANMFFLPLGWASSLMGYGDGATVSWLGIALNLSAATLGNIVGGSLFVALAYWFLHEPASQGGRLSCALPKRNR